jgi:hypothetical protein
MAKYLVCFPSAAMVVPDGEWEAVGRDSHAVKSWHPVWRGWAASLKTIEKSRPMVPGLQDC